MAGRVIRYRLVILLVCILLSLNSGFYWTKVVFFVKLLSIWFVKLL